MKNKLIITILILLMIFQIIVPIKINAFTETNEISSFPAQIKRHKAEEESVENEMTGLDLMAGIIIEPSVEFFTFIADGLMSLFSSFMTQKEYQFVMVKKEELEKIQNSDVNVGATVTIDNIEGYKTASGSLGKIKYPYFSYSPEEIFAGNLDLLDINFIGTSNKNDDWIHIRETVASWYKILRMVTIIGLLSILIYTGIKIIISSTTKDKAKYKEMLLNWFIAVILAFSMHYIMAFILNLVEEFTNLLQGLTGAIEVSFDQTTFNTNLIGLARFQMQQNHFSIKIGYMIIYIALITYTFKFTFVYLKRVLRMAFLTIIAPIVALTYPIDKMDGEAKGFKMWLREFIFNALLQPMHYILYYILVSSSLTLAARNPIYGIAALMFISQAEKLLKRIFGFNKAKAGMVGGIAGAFATGAITSSLIKHVKDPLHPLGGGKNTSKSNDSTSKVDNNEIELPENINEETLDIDKLLEIDFATNINMASNTNDIENNQEYRRNNSAVPQEMLTVGEFFKKYRNEIPLTSELSFKDEIPNSMEDILKLLEEYKKRGVTHGNIPELSEFTYEDLQNILRNRVIANESQFIDNGFLPGDIGYIDGDTRSTSQMMEDVIRLNETGKTEEAQNLLKKVKKRMIQNEYIQKNGGAQKIRQQLLENNENQNQQEPKINTTEQKLDNKDLNYNSRKTTREKNNIKPEAQEDSKWNNIKNKPLTKGLANVGKTIVKPVWDTEKTAKYNGKKLAGNILKGTVGVTTGVAAAAVQAGISITDGKFNILEGVATVGAGVVGVSQLSQSAGKRIQENRQDQISIKQYSEQWFNRDDIISNFNREFPGQGKEMRRRAVDNYVSRGITDFKEQKQALKYANKIMKERGLDVEEADKIAVATLQYKQGLTRNGNYNILFDRNKRKKYVDVQADVYVGASSKDLVKQLHEDLIQNVREFDKVNE